MDGWNPKASECPCYFRRCTRNQSKLSQVNQASKKHLKRTAQLPCAFARTPPFGACAQKKRLLVRFLRACLRAQDDGRLLWYLSVPADSWEVPNGHLCLRGARVSFSEGALLRSNLREDEVRCGVVWV